MEGAATNWPVIGLILAVALLGAIGLAVLVRVASKLKLYGQTYLAVVVGVAGTVIVTGPQIGWVNVAFVLLCFAVTGFVMGIEYFTRLANEAKEAQKEREESIQ